MLVNFPACLAFTLQPSIEGGFVDDPYDPGGATNHGITLAVFQEYRPGATVADLKNITAAEVQEIYQHKYWTAAHCSALPTGIDLMVFDMAVNAGPHASIHLLQHVVGTTKDGVFGPRTNAALQAHIKLVGVEKVILSLASAHYWYYHGLSTYNVFGSGWRARTKAREDAAIAMIKPAVVPSIAPPVMHTQPPVATNHQTKA